MERDALFTPISEFSEEQSFIQDDDSIDEINELDEEEHNTLTASFVEPLNRRESPAIQGVSPIFERESPGNIPDLLQTKRPTTLNRGDQRTGTKQHEATKLIIGHRMLSEKSSKTRDDGGSSSVTSGRITCGICLEDQQLPKLLPCMHSFCRHCLQQHISANSRQGVFACPLCRREIREPRNGASGFEDNIYYDTTHRQTTKCQACTEREVTTKCLECRQNYCHTCARIHLNMANSKGHHLSSMDNDGLETNLTPKLFCKTHRNKKLSYFCRDCTAVICGKCVIEAHARHNCIDVATVAHTYRQELRNNLESSNMGWRFVSALEDRYFEIKRARSAFQNDVAEEVLKIENQAEKLKEKIDRAARVMVDSLGDREKHITEKYNQAVDESETKLKWARNTLQTISQIVDVSGDAELVSRFVHMKDVLNDIKERVTLTEHDEHDVKFTRGTPSNPDLAKMIGCIDIRGPISMKLGKVLEFPLPGLEPPTIMAICPVSDTESWVFYEHFVQIVDKQGLRGKPIRIEDDVIDASIYMGKTVVVACPRRLICLTEDMIQDEVFTLSVRPSGIAVIQENIIVASKDSSSINIYTIDGKFLRDLNKDGGSRIFRQPYKVTVNDKHEIFVSDNVSKQIAVFSLSGSLMNTFEVAGLMPKVIHFNLHGNYLTVADEDQNVHAISGQGQYLQTVVASQQSLFGAISCIGVDFGGDLWIGNKSGKVQIFYLLEKKAI